jgi:hypothetical protein
MLILPSIIGIIFLVLVIGSPFIFKLIFKIKNFLGYRIGICCFIITSIILVILLVIYSIVLGVLLSNNDTNIESFINSLNDLNQLKDFPFIILFSLWIILVLIFLSIFLILYFYTKKISKEEDNHENIFMFFSGYILIPYTLYYLCCILLSFELFELNFIISEINTSVLIILIEIGALFFILLIAGSSIMMMLHHKKFNNLIIWLCVIPYYGPLIFYLIGFIILKEIFFTYLNLLCPVISIVFASFLYYKYASNQDNSGDEYSNIPTRN